MSQDSRILYCRCAFAQVVPQGTKDAVLQRLCASGATFEAVPDLCEMSARKDPRLQNLVEGDDPLRIVACHPRAVKWLFHAAGTDLPEDPEQVEILNMREQSAETICGRLLNEG